jgi:hypothetical protein
MGYERFSALDFLSPLPARQGPRAPVREASLRPAGHDAPKYSGPIFHALPSEIASFDPGWAVRGFRSPSP